MKVDDVLTREWQTVEQLMKKTKSAKPSVISRLNKLYNNWKAVEKKKENGTMYYRATEK
jgi:hypothetical protein